MGRIIHHIAVAPQQESVCGASEHIRRGIVKGCIDLIPVPVDLHHIPHVPQFVAGDRIARNTCRSAQHTHRQRIALTDRCAADHRCIGVRILIGQIIFAVLREIIVEKQNLFRIRPVRLQHRRDPGSLCIELLNHSGNLRCVIAVFDLDARYDAAGSRIPEAGINIEPSGIGIQHIVIIVRNFVKAHAQRAEIERFGPVLPGIPHHIPERICGRFSLCRRCSRHRLNRQQHDR